MGLRSVSRPAVIAFFSGRRERKRRAGFPPPSRDLEFPCASSRSRSASARAAFGSCNAMPLQRRPPLHSLQLPRPRRRPARLHREPLPPRQALRGPRPADWREAKALKDSGKRQTGWQIGPLAVDVRSNPQGNSIRLDDLGIQYYVMLWYRYLGRNRHLLTVAAEFDEFEDPFRGAFPFCQADVIRQATRGGWRACGRCSPSWSRFSPRRLRRLSVPGTGGILAQVGERSSPRARPAAGGRGVRLHAQGRKRRLRNRLWPQSILLTRPTRKEHSRWSRA
jgi:hypothetical protein